MKRTREWWARLSKQERSELVYLERIESRGGSGRSFYLPDDCSECGNCSTPHLGYGLCPLCSKRLDDLIRKASGLFVINVYHHGGIMAEPKPLREELEQARIERRHKISKENLYRLSDDMSAKFDGGNIILYDTRAYTPKRITVITSEEMTNLLALYTDGCCPMCLEEIPLNDIICDDCFERAQRVERV